MPAVVLLVVGVDRYWRPLRSACGIFITHLSGTDHHIPMTDEGLSGSEDTVKNNTRHMEATEWLQLYVS